MKVQNWFLVCLNESVNINKCYEPRLLRSNRTRTEWNFQFFIRRRNKPNYSIEISNPIPNFIKSSKNLN